MDSQEEKKWFVYLGDHHEGPFSVGEVHQRMSQGHVTLANYVWCDGMADWQMMAEVGELARPREERSGTTPALALPAADSPSLPGLEIPSAAEVTEVGFNLGSHPSLSVPGLSELPDSSIAPPVDDRPESMPAAVLESSPPAESRGSFSLGSIASGVQLERSGGGGSGGGGAGGVMGLKLAKNAPRVRLEAQPLPSGLVGRSRFNIDFRRIFRVIAMFLVIAGAGYGWMHGYVQAVFTSPAVRASAQAVSDLALPVLQKASERMPILRKFVSPIPHLADVSSDDNDDLRAAASEALDVTTPRAAVAASTADLASPLFYVASNLPDDSHLVVLVEGEPDTLLGTTSMRVILPVVLHQRLGKTAPAKTPQGTLLPRGQYKIRVWQGGELPTAGTKPLSVKSYFLGGVKDSIYVSRLHEFHDALMKKATRELDEIKQFSATFESQLDDTNHHYRMLKFGKLTPMRKKQWDTFHQRWKGMWAQMSDSFKKWGDGAPKGEYYYGRTFMALQQAGLTIADVHKSQDLFFSANADRSELAGQIDQVSALATSSLAALKARIELIEKRPPTPNGMPQKEEP